MVGAPALVRQPRHVRRLLRLELRVLRLRRSAPRHHRLRRRQLGAERRHLLLRLDLLLLLLLLLQHPPVALALVLRVLLLPLLGDAVPQRVGQRVEHLRLLQHRERGHARRDHPRHAADRHRLVLRQAVLDRAHDGVDEVGARQLRADPVGEDLAAAGHPRNSRSWDAAIECVSVA